MIGDGKACDFSGARRVAGRIYAGEIGEKKKMGEIRVDLEAKEVEMTEAGERRGLTFSRHFTRELEPGQTPYDVLEWEKRTASITNAKGEVVFEQHDVEVPRDWSQTATNIVASKYFHGTDRLARARVEPGSARSSRGRHDRRTGAATSGYFADQDDAENFRFELAHLMLNQMASFNSPVWFNVGVKTRAATAGPGTRSPSASPPSAPTSTRRSARPASSTRSTIRSSRS